MQRRSTGMMITGLILSGLGAVSLFTGVAVYAAGSSSDDCSYNGYGSSCSSDSGAQAAGVGFMVGGLIGIGVGIPLAIVGGRKVPVDPQAQPAPAEQASLIPQVSGGPRNIALRWHF
jgi:hypothetical protein